MKKLIIANSSAQYTHNDNIFYLTFLSCTGADETVTPNSIKRSVCTNIFCNDSLAITLNYQYVSWR